MRRWSWVSVSQREVQKLCESALWIKSLWSEREKAAAAVCLRHFFFFASSKETKGRRSRTQQEDVFSHWMGFLHAEWDVSSTSQLLYQHTVWMRGAAAIGRKSRQQRFQLKGPLKSHPTLNQHLNCSYIQFLKSWLRLVCRTLRLNGIQLHHKKSRIYCTSLRRNISFLNNRSPESGSRWLLYIFVVWDCICSLVHGGRDVWWSRNDVSQEVFQWSD